MDFIQDLSETGVDRIFVVGDVLGDYDKLINLLYQQRFSHKDIFVTTGNFINSFAEEAPVKPVNPKQLDALLFIKNVMTTYSVKGKNEFDFLRSLSGDVPCPTWLGEHPNKEDIIKFIEELPLIIKISDYIYIVNAGIQPNLSLDEQSPEVFSSIGDYDKDSRFYQFPNPDAKSWYEFEIPGKTKFCFGGKRLDSVEYPAGYCLGRKMGEPMRALIFRKGQDNPILIEA